MARLGRRFKKLGGTCGHIFTTIKTAGADSSPGPSMHKTPSVRPPWDSCHFQCTLGYQPPLFPWSGEHSDVPAVHHWFQESERVWDSAHIHQKIWLSTRDICLRLPCKKLSPRYIAPFTEANQQGSGVEDVPPPPVDPAENNIYRVHTILDSRRWGASLSIS